VHDAPLSLPIVTRRTDVAIDVAAAACPGVGALAATVVHEGGLGSQASEGPRVLTVCLPGGGMDRRYHDLDVVGDDSWSFAGHLARAGWVVVTLDPPGVGASDVPDDAWSLTPGVVADVLAVAAADIVARAMAGTLAPGLAPVVDPFVVGLGHSAGGLLIVTQQACHRTFDALVLLGYHAGGVPVAITADEAGYAGDPVRTAQDLEALARARFGEPLPAGTTATSPFLLHGDVPRAVLDALAVSSARLLGLVGLAAMIPGASAPELAAVEVPVFVGVGEHDITGDAHVIPAQVTASPDVALYVLAGSGHNHHAAPGRQLLWDRIVGWVGSIGPDVGARREGASAG
jgi:alpha-beta hydrolase superfamily lysophospholipase